MYVVLCLRSLPPVRHRFRAQSPGPSQAQSLDICREARKVTPGFPLAGTGPMDGVGSLPLRQSGTRQGRTGGGRSRPACCILAVGEFPVGHRYYGLLRLPNAHPRFLRGARSSPGTCRLRVFWYGSTRRSDGPFPVGALISRWTPREGDLSNGPRSSRQEADEALPSSRIIP